MLTVLGMGSPNVAKVLLMLEETALAYRFERWDVIRGAQHAPQFRALSPNGKVPVLIDAEGDGPPRVIAESGAILIYLAETSGRFLAPAGDARYATLQWLMIQMSAIGPVFGHATHLAAFARDEPYAVRRFTIELERLLALLDRRLADAPFLAGADYSLADIATYPWIVTAGRFFPDRLTSPAIGRWRDAIAARPAAERAKRVVDKQAALDRASFRAASPEELDRYFGRLAGDPVTPGSD